MASFKIRLAKPYIEQMSERNNKLQIILEHVTPNLAHNIKNMTMSKQKTAGVNIGTLFKGTALPGKG